MKDEASSFLKKHGGVGLRQFAGGDAEDEIVEGVRFCGDLDGVETEKRESAGQGRSVVAVDKRTVPSDVKKMPPVTYSEPIVAGTTTIKAAHILELRSGVK